MTNYYDINSKTFIEDTLLVDMSNVYTPFIKKLKQGASILDVGCGSGRDLRYFKRSGYLPVGLEPSRKLARYARDYAEVEVIEATIQDLNETRRFDSIWACASLLHLPSDELLGSFTKLSKLLNAGGCIYVSFKHGEFEGMKNGRFFNFQTIESVKSFLPSNISIEHHWISGDNRETRTDKWLNLILIFDQ